MISYDMIYIYDRIIQKVKLMNNTMLYRTAQYNSTLSYYITLHFFKKEEEYVLQFKKIA